MEDTDPFIAPIDEPATNIPAGYCDTNPKPPPPLPLPRCDPTSPPPPPPRTDSCCAVTDPVNTIPNTTTASVTTDPAQWCARAPHDMALAAGVSILVHSVPAAALCNRIYIQWGSQYLGLRMDAMCMNESKVFSYTPPEKAEVPTNNRDCQYSWAAPAPINDRVAASGQSVDYQVSMGLVQCWNVPAWW